LIEASGDPFSVALMLRQSARSAHEQVVRSLRCIRSSLEVERKKAPAPDSPVRRAPDSPCANNGLIVLTAALECETARSPWVVPSASAPVSERQPLPLIWWEIYPAVPKAIRFGEVEAVNEREAIEKAAKRFTQDPAKLIAARRWLSDRRRFPGLRPLAFSFSRESIAPALREWHARRRACRLFRLARASSSPALG
jgi:hypothetical protein